MAKQLTKLTLIAIIDGNEYALDMPLDSDISTKACNTTGLKTLTEGLAAQLGMSLEVQGIFPRSDASKYVMTENGTVVERPESDFKK